MASSVRHGILLPHANLHTITNGLNMTAIAAETIHHAANNT